MGIYADLLLPNHLRAELEEINVTALVDTCALHLCIPEHVAVQLRLQPLQAREAANCGREIASCDYVVPIRNSLLGGSA